MNSEKILLEEFIINHSDEAASLVEQLRVEQLVPFFNNLPIKQSVALIHDMDVFPALRCLEEIDIKRSAAIIENLPTNIASSFLRRMDNEKKKLILENMETQISRSLEQMLYHSENTAGALMDPQVPTIPEDLNVKDAFDRVRKSKQQSYQYIYVLDSDRKLIGIVKLEDLVIAEPKGKIESIMDKEFPHLLSEVEIKKVADHHGWLEYNSLPVLDRSGVFLGTLDQSVVRKTEIDKIRKVPKQAILASNALGELYRIGLSGLLYSTSPTKKEAE